MDYHFKRNPTIISSNIKHDLPTRDTLFLVALAGLTALIMAFVPFIDLLNYPFRLLITIIHELGHGVAALITGGRFLSFEVSPNGNGLAFTSGGLRYVIIPAGYLSVAIFTALLIMIGRSHRWSRRAMAAIGGMILMLTLFYARPSGRELEQLFRGLSALVMGLAFGSMFLWVALKATARWLIYLLHLVAIKAGLTTFSDLFYVINLSRLTNSPHNDATSMELATGIDALFWSLVWIVLAFVIISGAIWATWYPREKELHDPLMN